MIEPNLSERNFTPSSAGLPSCPSACSGSGVTPVLMIEQGQLTLTVTPAPGVSVLPLSSVARTRTFAAGWPFAIQVYDQLVVPDVAGCQVAPSSVETSMPATTPPPASVAVPPIVADWPSVTADGNEVMVDVGFVVSVDAAAAVRFDCRVAGWAPRSANRLTVACCMLRSSGVLPPLSASRPQAHCTVPELNTRAPLGALYIVMLCVAVPFCLTVLP